MNRENLNQKQFAPVPEEKLLGPGQGHYFEPQTEGSRWCAQCGHHASVTRHPEKK